MSPRRKVVTEGVPPAEREAVIVPEVVIGPPSRSINVVPAVFIWVIVPPPGTFDCTNATMLPIVKDFVGFPVELTSVPMIRSDNDGFGSVG